MPAQTSMLHIRVDDHLKAQAADALAGVGLTLSDAVRILGWIPVGGRIVSQGTLSLPLHNIEHSIFADPKVAGDPSV